MRWLAALMALALTAVAAPADELASLTKAIVEAKAPADVEAAVAHALAALDKMPAGAEATKARVGVLNALLDLPRNGKTPDRIRELAAAIRKSNPDAESLRLADRAALAMDFDAVTAAADSPDTLKFVWNRNGGAFPKAVRAFLTAHPKYTDAATADLLAKVSGMTDYAGDAELKKLIAASVKANLPEHRLVAVPAGEKPLDFEFAFTPVGTEKALSMKDLRGKVVVIDFWATWCPPCRAEMPENIALYKKFKEKGVEFIGVSLDRDEDALKNYCKENGITWPQAFGQGAQKLSGDWGVSGIPSVFILDKSGKLRSKVARGKLDKLIPELLEEALPEVKPGPKVELEKSK